VVRRQLGLPARLFIGLGVALAAGLAVATGCILGQRLRERNLTRRRMDEAANIAREIVGCAPRSQFIGAFNVLHSVRPGIECLWLVPVDAPRGELVLDAWGHPLVYRCPGRVHRAGWDLSSFGPNGVDDAGRDDDVLTGEDTPIPRAW